MYYYDIWLLIIPMVIALWAQSKVNSTYNRYSRVNSYRGVTGEQVARMILDQNGLQNVRIEQIGGNLTDHYDPRTNVVRLSSGVYGSSSIAAVGVAAHECGHAVQHATGYFPLKIRSVIIPATRFGSQMAFPLVLVGFFMGYYPLVLVGLVGFALIALFQLVTLPVEFNASSRAMAVISSSGMLMEDEQRGAQKVLSAAALTYVAALITSLSQLLRMVLIFGGRNRR